MNEDFNSGKIAGILFMLISVPLLIGLILFIDKQSKKESSNETFNVSNNKSKKIYIDKSIDAFKTIEINNNGQLNLEINDLNSKNIENTNLDYKSVAEEVKIEDINDLSCTDDFVFHSKSKCEGY